jgi:hypothetical protein
MLDNEGRGDCIKTITTHGKPKDQSEMSKFVERLIDEEIRSWTTPKEEKYACKTDRMRNQLEDILKRL